jgi:chitodextrinase
MVVSRRQLLATSALAAVAAPLGVATAAKAASPPGDVVGKITVGYQGWFAAIGDGSPINGWWHWANNWGQSPSSGNNAIVSWPDMRDYTNRYATSWSNLGNGQPATLFSQYDNQTIDTQFRWMQEYGCDTVALQRFNPFGGEGAIRDAVTVKVRAAAEARGRKFYIMYDVTDWLNMQSEIKTDWLNKMSAYTASPAYARQNGKPVVCVWGFGFSEPSRPFTPAPCLEVINWFKAQGCYVIGGVPTWWRLGINDSRPGFFEVYTAFNMISPWMVGRARNVGELDSYYNNVNLGDQAECNSRGIDYQPCVMPGDLSNHARFHGDFYWRHFYNMTRLGAQGIYISMFDEYNEGNQIAKTAENASQIPAGSSFVTLDEDGTVCSSDYYLRITKDAGDMFKGLAPLTAIRPTQPVVGQPTDPTTDLARGKAAQASSANGGFPASASVDGNQGSYWESANAAFPQWLQVDLGSAALVSRVVLKLPTGWGARQQNISVSGSTNGSSFSTIVGATGYTFDPASANTVAIAFPATSTRHVRLTIASNSGWPAGQVSSFEVYGSGQGGDTQPPTAPGNLTSPSKTANSVSLSWNASTDNVGVTGYQVRQGGNVVGTTAATSFTVTGLQPNTAYSFTVTAQDAAGNTSGPSNTLNVTTNPVPGNTNLALNKPTAESSHTQNYGSGNIVDGNSSSYWESANNAFPQWAQVDLGAAATVSRIVLKLPAGWGARQQNLSVSGSTNGSSFSTIVGSAGYTFNPGTGNAVTITFPATSARYIRLTFTANTGWPAGQLSELEVYQA